MDDQDVEPSARDWSSEDRSAVRWFVALPAAGSAIFTLAIFPTQPKWWFVVCPLTAVGAYTTAFLGVMPLLFIFRRYRWTRLVHYAVAGFVGVMLPWFVVGVFAEYLSSDSLQWRVGAALFLAASIGAAMAITFGWRQRLRV